MKHKPRLPNRIWQVCIVTLCLSIGLAGCGPRSHAVRPENMVPMVTPIADGHPGSVALRVDGGWHETILGLQLMPDEAILQAIETAVRQSGVFEKIADNGTSDFSLEAFIFDINQPLLGGGDATVLVEIAWTLSRLNSGAILWRESIETAHTTGADEAFSLYARVNLAAEAATKANIKTAIERIAALSF